MTLSPGTVLVENTLAAPGSVSKSPIPALGIFGQQDGFWDLPRKDNW